MVMPVPAGIGAGPVVSLANIPRGNEFDAAYSRLAYQQHADIIALANLGAQKAVDPNLRKFSEKIAKERTNMNAKLEQWYPQFACNTALSVDNTRINDITSELSGMTCQDFDRAYVATMISLMQQENRMANEATFKTTYAGLYDQSNLVKRVSYNEITALQNWMKKGVLSK